MRSRNPWRRARLRLFGWYVRFPLAMAPILEPRDEGRRSAGRRRVYGAGTSLDKGLDKRKNAKTTPFA
jgi:hypothetical protein